MNIPMYDKGFKNSLLRVSCFFFGDNVPGMSGNIFVESRNSGASPKGFRGNSPACPRSSGIDDADGYFASDMDDRLAYRIDKYLGKLKKESEKGIFWFIFFRREMPVERLVCI